MTPALTLLVFLTCIPAFSGFDQLGRLASKEGKKVYLRNGQTN